ncbi:MAG: glucose-1-phosphate adenylyltransferase subunit GlgD [Caldilineaceae bacterium]|nr:glucose-1-phosphate adenylyltransferase subunit GlgD [Caldilineaceae bacterium]
MARTLALIMAGGESKDLSVLTESRSEPAVPFGGKFRLIDFSLSNCINSDIYTVAVLTQYRPRSLNDHIGIGKPWDLDRASGGVRLLQPYRGGPYGDWQRGSADAVRRNLDYVARQSEEYVLILSGRHVSVMDYRPLIEQHSQTDADVTVAVRRVNLYETHRFGIVSTAPDGRIVEFQEKPRRSPRNLASMGIYVFRRDYLVELLADSTYVEFGNHVLPALLEESRRVQSYTFPGYWADISTVQAYWEANMSLMSEEPALDLYDPQWVIHTRSEERAPVKLGPNADVDGTLLSNGCQIDGTVERSVLSPGVRVAESAVVRDSIILNDTIIGPGVVVDRCIVDKGVIIEEGAQIGTGDSNKPNTAMPERLNTGITLIGKGSHIPAGISIGRNVVIHPASRADVFGKRKSIRSGSDVGRDMR